MIISPSKSQHTVKPSLPEYQVVIVGAGMVGGALACDLASRGVELALVEKQLSPPFDSQSHPDIRVSSVNLASEQYFKKLKTWPAIKSMRAQAYRRLEVWERLSSPFSQLLPDNLNHTAFNATTLDYSHLGHIIENQVIQLAQQEMWQAQDQVSCFEACGLETMVTDSQGATLTLSNGQQIRTQLVIGADGANSRVRHLSNLGVSSNAYHQHALVISVVTEGESQDITWQSFTPHGPLAYLPLPNVLGDSHASLVWYDKPKRLRQLLSLSEKELAEQIKREFPAQLPAIKRIHAKASFPLIKSHAQRYWKPRVALVGDAAHTINPLAGQGLNLGLQDARVLAEQLGGLISSQQDLGTETALAAYERARRPANLMMMSAMDAFYYIFSNNIPPLKLIRNLGLGIADKIAPAKQNVMAYALGISEKSLFIPN